MWGAHQVEGLLGPVADEGLGDGGDTSRGGHDGSMFMCGERGRRNRETETSEF